MGILKGPLTFTRYEIAENLPDRFLDFARERLVRHAFSGLETSERTKIVGWTGLEDILDTRFDDSRHVKGDFLLFSLRVDRKTVPASLLKVEAMTAERRYLAETGRDRLYREQKQDIRDRLHLSILQQSLPIPSFYDVCWSLSGQWLVFTSLAELANLDFLEIFKETFGFIPVPYLPWERPGRHLTPNDAEAHNSAIDVKTAGREFLTWLWFKSEERNGAINLPVRGDEIEVVFLRRLVLESGNGTDVETVTCHGTNTDLKEGKEALRQGKKIREGRIRLRIDADTWEFTFKADTYGFQSLKLPEVVEATDEKDTDSRCLERIYLMERAVSAMDDLFALFLTIRQSERWTNEEHPRMNKWLQAY
ncbi:MAG: recombination-associated protein RdgC [Syntrophales bacterium]|jgi:recombination associated protein RdgC|nr:recombination-associated protein RdgC [Syntrophales bacterium]